MNSIMFLSIAWITFRLCQISFKVLLGSLGQIVTKRQVYVPEYLQTILRTISVSLAKMRFNQLKSNLVQYLVKWYRISETKQMSFPLWCETRKFKNVDQNCQKQSHSSSCSLLWVWVTVLCSQINCGLKKFTQDYRGAAPGWKQSLSQRLVPKFLKSQIKVRHDMLSSENDNFLLFSLAFLVEMKYDLTKPQTDCFYLLVNKDLAIRDYYISAKKSGFFWCYKSNLPEDFFFLGMMVLNHFTKMWERTVMCPLPCKEPLSFGPISWCLEVSFVSLCSYIMKYLLKKKK